MAATLTTIQTVSPTSIGIVYNAQLHENAKFLNCCLTCNLCCWEKVKARTYVQVHENRLESNYSCMPICGLGLCCQTDNIRVEYFDRIQSTFKDAKCTPYHFCCIIGICGDVIAHAPMECCNTDCCRCCCPCLACNSFYPGLANGRELADYATKAREAFRRGERMLAVAPARQQMEMN